MNCDLRFASSTAKLTTAFAQRGIMAEHGLAWSLPRVVGVSKALDLLFSGRVIVAQEALELGIVDRVFAPDELMAKKSEYATTLAQYSSHAGDGRDQTASVCGTRKFARGGAHTGHSLLDGCTASRFRLQRRPHQLLGEATATVRGVGFVQADRPSPTPH